MLKPGFDSAITHTEQGEDVLNCICYTYIRNGQVFFCHIKTGRLIFKYPCVYKQIKFITKLVTFNFLKAIEIVRVKKNDCLRQRKVYLILGIIWEIVETKFASWFAFDI